MELRIRKVRCASNLKRYGLVLTFVIFSLLIFVFYANLSNSIAPNYIISHNAEYITPTKYLISTSKCRIPDVDPFNKDVAPFVKLETYRSCSAFPLLTYVETTGDTVKLKVNKSVISYYSAWAINCCYSKIIRNGDVGVTHSNCTPFGYEIKVTDPYFRVTCTNFYRTVYENVHAAIIPKDIGTSKDQSGKYSVILIGIDSVSKLNLERTMPKTYKYLERNYVNLKGYNKIGDNTYPNLIAILTGRSMTKHSPLCKIGEYVDDCDLIWKRFRENGYVTAYAEDEVDISTFNFIKPGFQEPPTDLYYRPYFLSAYKLPVRTKYSMSVCTGPENTGERVLNIVRDFVKTLKNHPKFGLFWMNSFSHGNVNFPSTMDAKMSEFLPDLKEWVRNSFVVVFSDHGFRFGNIRFTYTGWLEERLPFIYFKLPDDFPREMSRNFAFNAARRLTTPYDFHMTLQNILKLTNRSYETTPSSGCPKCQSLFDVVPENRSCADAAVNPHWCTCHGHIRMDTDLKIVRDVARYVVVQINQLVRGSDESGLCASYTLNSVVSAGAAQRRDDVDEYLVLIETEPLAMFEATVEGRAPNTFKLSGEISRLNKYKEYSSCVKDKSLKKYCYCNAMARLKSTICKLFNYYC